MHPADRLCTILNLFFFTIAASYKESDVSVIYQLSHQVLSSFVTSSC